MNFRDSDQSNYNVIMLKSTIMVGSIESIGGFYRLIIEEPDCSTIYNYRVVVHMTSFKRLQLCTV